MKKTMPAICLFLGLTSLVPGAADCSSVVLAEETRQALNSKGEIRNSLFSGQKPRLAPDVDIRTRIEADIRRLKPTVGVEMLILYEQKRGILDRDDILQMYNILRSISGLEGLKYYSASRKRMRTLFERSYTLAGPEGKVRIGDLLVTDLPEYSEIFVLQKDLTFGENIYRTEFQFLNGVVSTRTENLSTMRYFFLPMIQPGHSLNYILLIPCGNELLFYGVTFLRTPRLLGLERKKEDSLYNRMKAIYSWFLEKWEQAP